MKKVYLHLIFLGAFIYLGSAHVGLTFPKARSLDLDFLDFVRTKGPCGMPKGKTKTSVLAGSTINITWHLAYPHRGGFRIELLDKNESFLSKLSDPTSTDSYVTGDPTAQWHAVRLPNSPCEDCTIRLLREAKEWANYGYWSCADVSIMKVSDYREDCFGRGKPQTNSACICNKGYWGPRCQYKDECVTDNDCGTGKCIDIESTALPRKQCFCYTGFHGEHCQLQNKVTLPKPENLELSSHNMTAVTDRIKLYYRVIKNSPKAEADKEMEFVLVVNGTSYVAVGWRPASIDRDCKSMPAIEENTVSRRRRSPKSQAYKSNPTLLEPLHRTTGRLKSPSESSMNSKRSTKHKKEEAKPGPKPEPEFIGTPSTTGPSPEPGAEPEAEPEPAATNEPESNGKPEKDCSLSEPEGKLESIKSESETNGKHEPEPSSDSIPENSSQSEPEPEVSGKVQLDAEAEPSSEPKPPPPTSSEPLGEPISEPESETEPEPEPKSQKQIFTTESSSSSELESEPEKPAEPDPSAASQPDERAGDEAHAEPEPGSSENFGSQQPFKLERKATSYTPMDSLHPMDCSDIVIGAAQGMYSRIRDYYTRDRSTPRLDTHYGGSEDISSATGWEREGVTTIIFRRKIKTSDPTDHTLSGAMQIIVARGQEHREYVHNPPSGLETEIPSTKNFYSQDELKYHGQSTQRRVLFLTFPD